ncbi:hypothetical protein J7L67_02260 [bacterium]|nr:hypothetical protein [bacterium]
MSEEPKITTPKLELKDYVRAFFRRKGLFMIGFMAVTPLVFPIILGLPNIYHSSTTILIRDKSDIKILKGQSDLGTSIKERVRTFGSEIKSWNNIIRAMDAVGLSDLANTPLEMEFMVNRLRKNLSISTRGSTRNTDIIKISFWHKDPVVTQRFLNVITTNFIEKSLKDQRVEIFSTINFIKEQLAVYEEKLKESEAKLIAFKREHLMNMPNVVGSPRALTNLEKNKINISFDLEKLQHERKYIADQISVLEKTGGGSKVYTKTEIDPVQEDLKKKLQRLNTMLENMEIIYTEQHPDMIDIKNQIAATKEKITGRQSQLKEYDIIIENEKLKKLRHQLNKIDLQIARIEYNKRRIESEMQNKQEQLEELPTLTEKYAYLQHEHKKLKNIFFGLQQKLEATRMTQHIESTEQGITFEILEPARLPLKPAKPNRWRILLMGMLAGLAVGGGIAFLVEFTDHSFKGTEDARLNLPIAVIGVIPSIITARERRRKRIKNFLFGCLSVMYLIGLGVVSAYVYKFYH